MSFIRPRTPLTRQKPCYSDCFFLKDDSCYDLFDRVATLFFSRQALSATGLKELLSSGSACVQTLVSDVTRSIMVSLHFRTMFIFNPFVKFVLHWNYSQLC